MPEADRAKRAKENNMTIYEMVRNPELYELGAYLDASDIALQEDPANIPVFVKMAADEDSAIRYWGSVGLYLVAGEAKKEQGLIRKLLSDESHEVRAMAAYTLYRQGDTAAARAAFNDLLKNNSYASLKVLNMIDWIGEGADAHRDVIQAANLGSYESRMRVNLGMSSPAKPKKKGRQKDRGKKK